MGIIDKYNYFNELTSKFGTIHWGGLGRCDCYVLNYILLIKKGDKIILQEIELIHKDGFNLINDGEIIEYNPMP